MPAAPSNAPKGKSSYHIPEVRTAAEIKLGIHHYTSVVDFGWVGDIRKRYVASPQALPADSALSYSSYPLQIHRLPGERGL